MSPVWFSRTTTTRTPSSSPPATTIPAGGFLALDVDRLLRPGCRRLRATLRRRRHDAHRQLQLDRSRRDDLRPLPRRHRRVRDHNHRDEGRRQRLQRACSRQRGRVERRSSRRLDRAEEPQPSGDGCLGSGSQGQQRHAQLRHPRRRPRFRPADTSPSTSTSPTVSVPPTPRDSSPPTARHSSTATAGPLTPRPPTAAAPTAPASS